MKIIISIMIILAVLFRFDDINGYFSDNQTSSTTVSNREDQTAASTSDDTNKFTGEDLTTRAKEFVDKAKSLEEYSYNDVINVVDVETDAYPARQILPSWEQLHSRAEARQAEILKRMEQERLAKIKDIEEARSN